MALADMMNIPPDANGNLSAGQINQAFKDVYGIDAPPQVLYDFAGHISNGDAAHFYERVSKGDFVPDIQKRDPGYFQQAQTAQLAQQQINTNKQAFAPLIPSLEQSKTSLQARYDAILGDLTNRETSDTNNLTKATASDYAKRGISLSSDAYARELANQLNPIHAQYGTQRATQSAQEGTDLNNIDQTIAQYKAGNPATAIAAGNSLAPSVMSNQLSQQTTVPLTNEQIRASQVTNQSTSQQYSDLNSLIKQLGGAHA